MVKFGDYTLPRVLAIQTQHGDQLQEVPLPGREFPYRKRTAGLGARFTVSGAIRPSSQLVKDQIAALADGTARILDLEEVDLTVMEKCFRYQTGPVWTDNTTESQTPGGTPFTLLGAATDYAYFGHREKFNKIQFDLETLGSYGARTWEYSDGAGGWKTLTIDSDGTNGFSQDGAVAFTPPGDWKQDTVNSAAGKFWIRVKVASVTTAATANQIQINKVFNCIMLSPEFQESAEDYNEIPYGLTFVQQENP